MKRIPVLLEDSQHAQLLRLVSEEKINGDSSSSIAKHIRNAINHYLEEIANKKVGE